MICVPGKDHYGGNNPEDCSRVYYAYDKCKNTLLFLGWRSSRPPRKARPADIRRSPFPIDRLGANNCVFFILTLAHPRRVKRAGVTSVLGQRAATRCDQLLPCQKPDCRQGPRSGFTRVFFCFFLCKRKMMGFISKEQKELHFSHVATIRCKLEQQHSYVLISHSSHKATCCLVCLFFFPQLFLHITICSAFRIRLQFGLLLSSLSYY